MLAAAVNMKLNNFFPSLFLLVHEVECVIFLLQIHNMNSNGNFIQDFILHLKEMPKQFNLDCCFPEVVYDSHHSQTAFLLYWQIKLRVVN